MTRSDPTPPALVVLSHLRWDFVFQRPQHLMSRAARTRRVYFVQTPIFGGTPDRPDHIVCEPSREGVFVCTPQIRAGLTPAESQARTARALREFLEQENLEGEGAQPYVLWVYTPMELPVAAELSPALVTYDCMDELKNFKGAPPELIGRERDLLRRADVVFTGGHRLYEAKRERHPNVHPFPSSVDVPHFAQARDGLQEPDDQRDIPHPRLGFFGVIDERFDVALLRELAARRPDWQFVLLGPVVKIDPAELPDAPNIHKLGMKSYAELPGYLGGWDVALLPFALNAATEFISPTKTPEYLAGGVPVVSTGIRDVIRPYGERGLVRVADGVDAFEQACADALAERSTLAGEARRAAADEYLGDLSWETTWAGMDAELEAALERRGGPPSLPTIPSEPQTASRAERLKP